MTKSDSSRLTNGHEHHLRSRQKDHALYLPSRLDDARLEDEVAFLVMIERCQCLLVRPCLSFADVGAQWPRKRILKVLL